MHYRVTNPILDRRNNRAFHWNEHFEFGGGRILDSGYTGEERQGFEPVSKVFMSAK